MAPVDVILAQETCVTRPWWLRLSGALHLVHDNAADDGTDHGRAQIDPAVVLSRRAVGLMPAIAIIEAASVMAAMLHAAPVLIIAIAILHLYQIIPGCEL